LVKIVATIGPASRDPATLGRLLDAGVDVVRLNFSHGTQAEHAETIRHVRTLAAERGRHVALLQDLQGPKLRVGELEDGGPVRLVAGATVELVSRSVLGTAERFSVTYDRLAADVRVGDRVLLDDGAIELGVEEVRAEDGDEAGGAVACRVVHGGELLPRKGVNLPGTAVSVPALTPKDLDDLAFGVAQGVDYVALSFVRAASDLRQARAAIRRLGGRQPLVAKIEKPQALAHLDAVVRAADAVMVARGDLGVELSVEAVPMAQKRIIRAANAAGIPVITATQMLESMIANPRPTRAEASDVANAILDGTDAVMLSGETAVGVDPVAAVATMARIAHAAERDPAARPALDAAADVYRVAAAARPTDALAVAEAARALARGLDARCVAVLTRTGRTAGRLSKGRPGLPIVAFTDRPAVARRLALWHGVTALAGPIPPTTDAAVAHVEAGLRAEGLADAGTRVVVVGATRRPALADPTLFVQVVRLGADASGEG
jgi:pyruvate kinase